MFKKRLKVVLFLSLAVSGVAVAGGIGMCQFCDVLYNQCINMPNGPLKKPAAQCLAEYVDCRQSDCPAP